MVQVPPFPPYAWRLILSALGVGLVLIAWGTRGVRLDMASASAPQTITCRALSERGPGDNAWVIMTDYELLEEEYVVEQRTRGGQPVPGMDRAWVPAIPSDHPYLRQVAEAPEGTTVPRPSDWRVLVQRFEHGLRLPLLTPTAPKPLEGMVINEVSGVDAEVARLLREAYPGVDIRACWILDQYKRPGSEGGWGMLIGGLVACVLAFAGFIFAWHQGESSLQKAQAAAQAQEDRRRKTQARRAAAAAARAAPPQDDDAGEEPPDDRPGRGEAPVPRRRR